MSRKYLFFILLSALLFTGFLAHAQICQPDASNPNALCNPIDISEATIPTFIKDHLFYAATEVIGIIAIGMVAYSGFRMVTSQGNQEEVAKAKSSLQWSIVGVLVIVLAFVIISAVNEFVGGQTPGSSLGSSGISNSVSSDTILGFATDILKNFLGIATVAALLLIMVSGFRYITARGNEEQASQAKAGLQWSVIGLIVILLAYVIVAAVGNLVNAPI